ncbi:15334_t:CDS:2 [Gigaspora rosea]|nr:15334_t:CDS:2 [Gigaspora rosea]
MQLGKTVELNFLPTNGILHKLDNKDLPYIMHLRKAEKSQGNLVWNDQ